MANFILLPRLPVGLGNLCAERQEQSTTNYPPSLEGSIGTSEGMVCICIQTTYVRIKSIYSIIHNYIGKLAKLINTRLMGIMCV